MSKVNAYVYDGGGIPSNHIVNLTPDQQRNFRRGSEYVMAGFDSNRVPPGTTPTIANAWYRVKSDRPGYPPFESVGWATGGNPPGSDLPSFPLYGLLGTESEGVMYDVSTQRFYRPVDAPPVIGSGSGSSVGGDPYRPSGALDAAAMPNRAGKELGLYNGKSGGIWYAATQAQSLACSDHTGIAYAGPDTWQGVWGKPGDNGLPDGLYLVTADDPMDPRTARPASQEWATVVKRAQNGDEAAILVMDFFGQSTEVGGGDSRGESIWDDIGDALFG